jgi:hypothetical protein
VEENTTKTIIKNTGFAFFTKEVKGSFGNLAQLYICGGQMDAEAEGTVKYRHFKRMEPRVFLGN